MELIILTQSFPYGKGETFLESEISFLQENFNKISIIACEVVENSYKRKINEDIEVIPNIKEKNRRVILLKSIKQLLIIDNLTEFVRMCMRVRFNRECIKNFLYYIFNEKRVYDILNDYIKNNIRDDFVLYSYWLDLPANVISSYQVGKDIEKNRNITLKKKIARCHRYDLYEEENKFAYIPFRKHILSNLDYILPISNDGKDYLRNKYPKIGDKIHVFKLGIMNKLPYRCPVRGNVFKIVSCSNLVKVKRVSLIANALIGIENYRIEWTHFGDGPLKEELEEIASNNKNSNLDIIFRGHVENKTLYEEYEKNQYNLFINVSSSEGIPVSIMEACSFGIPIIATDVGGTKEIVKNGYNGTLLNENFKISELQKCVISYIEMDDKQYESYSLGAYQMWHDNYNAEKNYSDFINFLKEG